MKKPPHKFGSTLTKQEKEGLSLLHPKLEKLYQTDEKPARKKRASVVAVKEKDVQAYALKSLKAIGVFCYRNQSFALPIQNSDGKRYFIKQGVKGIPDIVGFIAPRGVYLGVECKSSVGKQSAEQIEFEAILKQAGGLYYLVNSLEAVDKMISEIKVLTNKLA